MVHETFVTGNWFKRVIADRGVNFKKGCFVQILPFLGEGGTMLPFPFCACVFM